MGRDEIVGGVPAGSVEHNHGMGVGGDAATDLAEARAAWLARFFT